MEDLSFKLNAPKNLRSKQTGSRKKFPELSSKKKTLYKEKDVIKPISSNNTVSNTKKQGFLSKPSSVNNNHDERKLIKTSRSSQKEIALKNRHVCSPSYESSDESYRMSTTYECSGTSKDCSNFNETDDSFAKIFRSKLPTSVKINRILTPMQIKHTSSLSNHNTDNYSSNMKKLTFNDETKSLNPKLTTTDNVKELIHFRNSTDFISFATPLKNTNNKISTPTDIATKKKNSVFDQDKKLKNNAKSSVDKKSKSHLEKKSVENKVLECNNVSSSNRSTKSIPSDVNQKKPIRFVRNKKEPNESLFSTISHTSSKNSSSSILSSISLSPTRKYPDSLFSSISSRSSDVETTGSVYLSASDSMNLSQASINVNLIQKENNRLESNSSSVDDQNTKSNKSCLSTFKNNSKRKCSNNDDLRNQTLNDSPVIIQLTRRRKFFINSDSETSLTKSLGTKNQSLNVQKHKTKSLKNRQMYMNNAIEENSIENDKIQISESTWSDSTNVSSVDSESTKGKLHLNHPNDKLNGLTKDENNYDNLNEMKSSNGFSTRQLRIRNDFGSTKNKLHSNLNTDYSHDKLDNLSNDLTNDENNYENLDEMKRTTGSFSKRQLRNRNRTCNSSLFSSISSNQSEPNNSKQINISCGKNKSGPNEEKNRNKSKNDDVSFGSHVSNSILSGIEKLNITEDRSIHEEQNENKLKMTTIELVDNKINGDNSLEISKLSGHSILINSDSINSSLFSSIDTNKSVQSEVINISSDDDSLFSSIEEPDINSKKSISKKNELLISNKTNSKQKLCTNSVKYSNSDNKENVQPNSNVLNLKKTNLSHSNERSYSEFHRSKEFQNENQSSLYTTMGNLNLTTGVKIRKSKYFFNSSDKSISSISDPSYLESSIIITDTQKLTFKVNNNNKLNDVQLDKGCENQNKKVLNNVENVLYLKKISIENISVEDVNDRGNGQSKPNPLMLKDDFVNFQNNIEIVKENNKSSLLNDNQCKSNEKSNRNELDDLFDRTKVFDGKTWTDTTTKQQSFKFIEPKDVNEKKSDLVKSDDKDLSTWGTNSRGNIKIKVDRYSLNFNFNKLIGPPETTSTGDTHFSSDMKQSVSIDKRKSINKQLRKSIEIKRNALTSDSDGTDDEIRVVTKTRRKKINRILDSSSSDGVVEISSDEEDDRDNIRSKTKAKDKIDVRSKNNKKKINDLSNQFNDVLTIHKKPTQPEVLKPKKNPFATPKRNQKNISSVDKIQSIKDIPNTPLRTDQVSKKNRLTFLSSLTAPIPEGYIAHPESAIYKTKFKSKKEELSRRLFNLFNKEIFGGQLPDDMPLEWNGRMRTTSGFCYNKRTKSIDPTKPEIRSSRIALSKKILDTPDRLRDTLVHELCHAASWLIDGMRDGHGPNWKKWTIYAMQRFPELPPIKRCHDYKIETKYVYRCSQCDYEFGRHSKSLDIERKVCGYCHGKFILLTNTGKGQTKSEDQATKRPPTQFALFVKDNYAKIKQENIGIKHGDVMKLLSKKFAETKIQKSQT